MDVSGSSSSNRKNGLYKSRIHNKNNVKRVRLGVTNSDGTVMNKDDNQQGINSALQVLLGIKDTESITREQINTKLDNLLGDLLTKIDENENLGKLNTDITAIKRNQSYVKKQVAISEAIATCLSKATPGNLKAYTEALGTFVVAAYTLDKLVRTSDNDCKMQENQGYKRDSRYIVGKDGKITDDNGASKNQNLITAFYKDTMTYLACNGKSVSERDLKNKLDDFSNKFGSKVNLETANQGMIASNPENGVEEAKAEANSEAATPAARNSEAAKPPEANSTGETPAANPEGNSTGETTAARNSEGNSTGGNPAGANPAVTPAENPAVTPAANPEGNSTGETPAANPEGNSTGETPAARNSEGNSGETTAANPEGNSGETTAANPEGNSTGGNPAGANPAVTPAVTPAENPEAAKPPEAKADDLKKKELEKDRDTNFAHIYIRKGDTESLGKTDQNIASVNAGDTGLYVGGGTINKQFGEEVQNSQKYARFHKDLLKEVEKNSNDNTREFYKTVGVTSKSYLKSALVRRLDLAGNGERQGTVILDVFAAGKYPHGNDKNRAMLYVIPPKGTDYTGNTGKDDFLKAVRETARNIMLVQQEYNKRVEDKEEVIPVLRGCAISSSGYKHSSATDDDVTEAIELGYQLAIADIKEKDEELTIKTIQYEYEIPDKDLISDVVKIKEEEKAPAIDVFQMDRFMPILDWMPPLQSISPKSNNSYSIIIESLTTKLKYIGGIEDEDNHSLRKKLNIAINAADKIDNPLPTLVKPLHDLVDATFNLVEEEKRAKAAKEKVSFFLKPNKKLTATRRLEAAVERAKKAETAFMDALKLAKEEKAAKLAVAKEAARVAEEKAAKAAKLAVAKEAARVAKAKLEAEQQVSPAGQLLRSSMNFITSSVAPLVKPFLRSQSEE